MAKFSNTWFEDNVARIWSRRLIKRFGSHGNIPTGGLHYLEIGVCEGASMLWILENLPCGLCVGIDPWIPPREKQEAAFANYEKHARGNLAKWVAMDLVQLVKATSYEVLAGYHEMSEQVRSTTYDLIYVDGAHDAPSALQDLVLSFELLRPSVMRGKKLVERGGCMIVDDMQRTWQNGRPLVFFAVWMFELIYKGRVQREWTDGRQVAFTKLK